MALPTYYATIADVQQALPVIGSHTNITSAQLTRYIGTADAIINSKLANRYTVPVSPSPPLLTAISTDLTLYYLLGKRIAATGPGMGGASGGFRNEWFDRYKQALELLAEIASGDMALINSSGGLIEQAPSSTLTGQVWSSTMANTPTFDTDAKEWEVYAVDGLKLWDQ